MVTDNLISLGKNVNLMSEGRIFKHLDPLKILL